MTTKRNAVAAAAALAIGIGAAYAVELKDLKPIAKPPVPAAAQTKPVEMPKPLPPVQRPATVDVRVQAAPPVVVPSITYQNPKGAGAGASAIITDGRLTGGGVNLNTPQVGVGASFNNTGGAAVNVNTPNVGVGATFNNGQLTGASAGARFTFP